MRFIALNMTKLISTSFIPRFIACSILFLCSSTLVAEQVIKQDNYLVHYSAFPSTALSAKVVSTYGFKRSNYIALLNITPQKVEEGVTLGVKSEVTGKVQNLIGNSQKLDFKEIIEGDVVYYIAEFTFSNEEHFRFMIDIKALDGSDQHITLRFEQKFYRDE